MSWTVEDIKEYCRELSKKVGDDFDCNVKINSRLTRTLGRVISVPHGAKYKYDILEISKHFLDTSTDESIKSVIEHEFAHYLAVKRTGVVHNHDDYFKSICAEIGCDNNRPRTKVERTVSEDKVYRYSVFCPNCGFIGGYSRMNDTLRYLDLCTCSKCSSDGLSYKKNW